MLLVAREEVETLILLKSPSKDVLSTGSRAGAQVLSPWILSLSRRTALTARALTAALGWPHRAICPSDALRADFCLGISRAQMASTSCAVYPREPECHICRGTEQRRLWACVRVCVEGGRVDRVVARAHTHTSCLFKDLDQDTGEQSALSCPHLHCWCFVCKSLE